MLSHSAVDVLPPPIPLDSRLVRTYTTGSRCGRTCRGRRLHTGQFPLDHSSDNNACDQPPTTPKETVRNSVTSQAPYRCGVHRMPPELLGIIFENCLDVHLSSDVALLQAPLLLGHVCRYWRVISQGSPRLWTSLSLRFLETNVSRSHDDTQVTNSVETWLHRSYPLPLCISFVDHRIFQKDTEEVVIWLLSRIRMHAPRWKAIHFRLSSDYFTKLSMLSSCAFTSLVSFSAHIDHMGWRSSLLSLHLDLTQATRLTALAYTGPEHVLREDILVNWVGLTSASLSYDLHESGGGSATLRRNFLALALCRNLTELSIGLGAQHLHPLDAIGHGQTIELPRLHTLRARRLSRTAHTCALLDALRLPQLSALYIDSAVLAGWDGSHLPMLHPNTDPLLPIHMQVQTQTHWWHAHHFSALLHRSACRLHTLHIRDVDISPLELMHLLTSPSTSGTLSMFTFEPFPRAYPLSEMLALLVSAPLPSLCPDPRRVINFTSVSNPLLPSFPSLIKLRLGCAHGTLLDPLADMIESRTGDRARHAGVRSLGTFELVFYDFVYCHGQGGQPRRKACFDVFKERVLKCAHEGGVDVDIKVERPYEPVYLSVP